MSLIAVGPGDAQEMSVAILRVELPSGMSSDVEFDMRDGNV